MNVKFHLGKVRIPVSEEVLGNAIHLEDVSFEMEGLDLKEYLMVLKEMPSIVKGLKEAVEGSAPSPTGITPVFQVGKGLHSFVHPPNGFQLDDPSKPF